MVTAAAPDITKPSATRLIVVSGMSGSGKTIALRTLEDLDYYCVDNLPGSLLPAFVAEVAQAGLYPRLAVGIDVRNRAKDLNVLPQVLADVATQGIEHRLIFLDARDEVLFKRYSDTRRRHPLTGEGVSLADAIARERKLLKPLSSIADRVIDTGDLNVHQLRRLIATEFGMADGPLSLLFESFAYKRGVPPDADFVFDARCLPNPHWDAQMRPLSGRDAAVRAWLENKPDVMSYLHDVENISRHVVAALRGGKPFLCDDLHRLHGRTASLGVFVRTFGRTFPRRTRSGAHLPPRTGLTAITMRVGILLLTHETMGAALIATARHILGRLALPLDTLAVPPGSDVETALRETATRVRALDQGDGVLVLTDVYGATPSNIAEHLHSMGLDVRRVSGLNLPMLLRVLNYPEQSLEELTQTAASGGRAGIHIDHA